MKIKLPIHRIFVVCFTELVVIVMIESMSDWATQLFPSVLHTANLPVTFDHFCLSLVVSKCWKYNCCLKQQLYFQHLEFTNAERKFGQSASNTLQDTVLRMFRMDGHSVARSMYLGCSWVRPSGTLSTQDLEKYWTHFRQTSFQQWWIYVQGWMFQVLGSRGQSSSSWWGPTCWKMHFWPC